MPLPKLEGGPQPGTVAQMQSVPLMKELPSYLLYAKKQMLQWYVRIRKYFTDILKLYHLKQLNKKYFIKKLVSRGIK